VTGGGKRPAVFLDRDGVLNVLRRADYVKTPDELVLLPGAAQAVHRLNALGLPVFVISNQQGVAKSLMTAADLDAVDAALRTTLDQEAPGAHLDGAYYCPHGAGDACACRKPQPGLIEQAAREHELDLARSFFVGDAPTDAQAARAAGVGHFVLVLTGALTGETEPAAHLSIPPAYVAADLAGAVAFIAASSAAVTS